ncbi:hypothetical protein ACP4OV_020005 [Aristida adscensionis]
MARGGSCMAMAVMAMTTLLALASSGEVSAAAGRKGKHQVHPLLPQEVRQEAQLRGCLLPRWQPRLLPRLPKEVPQLMHRQLRVLHELLP